MAAKINAAEMRKLTAEILRRHTSGEAEANITSAVRRFLVESGLAKNEEIREEAAPAEGSSKAVDLIASDTFIEMKRRVCGTRAGFNPDPEYVKQIDEYLAASEQETNSVRTGILTDGKYWLMRWSGAGEVVTNAPYGFVLESADGWLPLYEWLRDEVIVALDDIPATRENIARHLGTNSPAYQKDIDALKALYAQYSRHETIKVKRGLWHDLLRAALGEMAQDRAQMDDLFVRHTYLTAIIGMVAQASLGIDLKQLAADDPADLMYGRAFRNATGLQGVVESDFFAWPAEVGGLPLLATMARHVAKFDWRDENTPNDIAAILYETVIPPDERRTLGEYYTPHWLARAITRELVPDPLNKRMLDPSCGSGTFIAEAITHFLEAAERANIPPDEVFGRLRHAVTGIDIHPVAVHLARSAYVLAARGAILASSYTSITIPIYMGDALQLRYRAGDMFSEHEIAIQVNDDANTELLFPVSLVERPETFDALMGDVAECIESGDDPMLALDDHHITDKAERSSLRATIATIQELHAQGRNHIWAYYTRNMARPVALSRSKVDVIIGNPPWINYNDTVDVLRAELETQSKSAYGIWAGGRHAPNQDVAGLFFARSVDLYLENGGVIGMVLPHSALQAGQYTKWRTGAWTNNPGTRTLAVNFGYKTAWDLERLKPNNFFPVPSSVVFAENLGIVGEKGTPLAGHVEQWSGAAGADDVRRVNARITDTSQTGTSPYNNYARRGADIFPRCLYFVHATESTTSISSSRNIKVNPRRGSNDKAPWKDLDLTKITRQTIEKSHVFNVYLGETVAPYTTLEPLNAILPFKHGDAELPIDDNDIAPRGLDRMMRRRWQAISQIWEDNKAQSNKLSLLGRLNYHNGLQDQLKWQNDAGDRSIRIIYGSAGIPTAALLNDREAIVDYKLFYVRCATMEEAHYLLSIINSDTLKEAVAPLMSKGQFGARDVQKHLWKLPIPEYDGEDALHVEISDAGKAAADGAAQELANLREARGEVTVTIARRELRNWLRASAEGARVETAVSELLAAGG